MWWNFHLLFYEKTHTEYHFLCLKKGGGKFIPNSSLLNSYLYSQKSHFHELNGLNGWKAGPMGPTVPLAKFQYNNHVHSLTKHPLFLLETGQLLCMGFEPDQCPSCIESINKFTDQMKNTLEEAKAALSKSKDQRYYNQRQSAAPSTSLGTKSTLMPVISRPPKHPKSCPIIV